MFTVEFVLEVLLIDELKTIFYVFETWKQQQVSVPTVMLYFADILCVTLSSDMPTSFD